MTHKLQVKEHLRNGALYQPVTEPSLGEEWKRQLFFQHFMHRQLKAALQERKRFHKGFICIGIPILCVLFIFAAYFGYIYPEHWFENIALVVNFYIPQIGLKEILVFIGIVNGLTFFIKKRVFL